LSFFTRLAGNWPHTTSYYLEVRIIAGNCHFSPGLQGIGRTLQIIILRSELLQAIVIFTRLARNWPHTTSYYLEVRIIAGNSHFHQACKELAAYYKSLPRVVKIKLAQVFFVRNLSSKGMTQLGP
jgi:hypothetical protein